MKSTKIKRLCIILISMGWLNTNAQSNKQSTISFSYNYQLPIGNLAKTFGSNSAIGISFLTEKRNNFLFGLEANYLFGDNVKDSTIFDNISTSNGSIIGADGYYANVNVMQRGFDCYLFSGYAFHFKKNNLSGIYVSQGFGYLQHQIFISTKNQNVPQLSEEMKQGYDRLSSGLSTKFSVDYKYYHKKERFQISAGLNYTMAYSKNQRTYDFANNSYYTNKKTLDQLLGYKIEIIIPIQRNNKEEFHYY